MCNRNIKPGAEGNREITRYSFSADGSRVVYRGDDETDNLVGIYSVGTGGTGRVLLSEADNPNGASEYWIAPDSSRVVFSSYRAEFPSTPGYRLFSCPISGPNSALVDHLPIGSIASSSVSISPIIGFTDDSQSFVVAGFRFFDGPSSISEFGFAFQETLPIACRLASSQYSFPLAPLSAQSRFNFGPVGVVSEVDGVVVAARLGGVAPTRINMASLDGTASVDLLGDLSLGDANGLKYQVSRGGAHAIIHAAGDVEGQPELYSVNLVTGASNRLTPPPTSHFVDFRLFGGFGDGERAWFLGDYETNGVEELFLLGPSFPEIGVEDSEGGELRSGRGIIDFGLVAVGGEITRKLVIRNNGGASLLSLDASLTADPSGDFALQTALPSSLAEDTATEIVVRFAPALGGPQSQVLSIASNDSDENPYIIQLTGTGGTAREVVDSVLSAAGLSGPDGELAAIPFDDGVPNLLKFAFNMNLAGADSSTMTAGGSSGLPTYSIDSSGAETVWKVEFVRRKGSGLVYQPMKSTTLGDFVPMTGEATVTDIPGETEWERVIVAEPCDPTTTPRCFSHVVVDVP